MGDFPFAADMHRAAWLAALLTPLARPAFDGPAPLFLVDANVRAAGKGLCLEVDLPDRHRQPVPGHQLPGRTRRTARRSCGRRSRPCLLYGDRMALFDNLTGGVRGRHPRPGPDRDRVAGPAARRRTASSAARWPSRSTRPGTTSPSGPTPPAGSATSGWSRPHERPEERADLQAAAPGRLGGREPRAAAGRRADRPAGVPPAGRPDFSLKPWGSFEGVVAGGAERRRLVRAARPRRDAGGGPGAGGRDRPAGCGSFFAALEMIDPERAGQTAAEIVGRGHEEDSPRLAGGPGDARRRRWSRSSAGRTGGSWATASATSAGGWWTGVPRPGRRGGRGQPVGSSVSTGFPSARGHVLHVLHLPRGRPGKRT